MNVSLLLDRQAQKYGDKPALIFKEQEISFRTLRENVLKTAAIFKQAGVGKSDKVGIYLPNGPECVYSYLACFCLGAVAVPLDYMLKTDELVSCLTHAEVKLLIAQPRPDVDLKHVAAQVSSIRQLITAGEGPVDGARHLSDELAAATAVPIQMLMNEKDPALIMYTSGTTGKPKGILLNCRHLDGSPEAMKHFVDLTGRDVKLAAIPFSHIGGFIYIQNCLVFGITLVIMDRFNPYEFLRCVERYRVTCFHIVPPMYTALLTLKQIEKFNLSSLRWVVVFGAPSTPEIMERFHKYCPNAQLLNGWGMTETCPPNTVTPMGSQNIASVGKPAPHCRIRIVDENGGEVPIGQIGEITISGWIVTDGYYKDPETTAATVKDGWLYTGDLGRFDEQGFLYIVGRKKEMIKVGGQIVFAPEVEAALYKNEKVAEAAVVGIPDKFKGEAVKAFVVLKEAGLSPEDLRYFLRAHLANFKVPQTIEIRETLPKNRTGKIDKELLKQETFAS